MSAHVLVAVVGGKYRNHFAPVDKQLHLFASLWTPWPSQDLGVNKVAPGKAAGLVGPVPTPWPASVLIGQYLDDPLTTF